MEIRRNHSPWKTRVKTIAGKKFYQVYRLIDVKYGEAERNCETRGGCYERLFDAEKLAATLNAEEKK